MGKSTIEFELRGVTQMRSALKETGAELRRRIVLSLRLEGERITTGVKRNRVPVDKGTLRASGHTTPVEDTGAELRCQIVFGGPSAPYAAAVHEHPSSSSPPSWRDKGVGDIHAVRPPHTAWDLEGRGPKYLERELKAAEPGFSERIAKAARI